MVELPNSIFENFNFEREKTEGSIQINNPEVKIIFHNLYKDLRRCFKQPDIHLESLIIQALSVLEKQEFPKNNTRPDWIKKVDELLHSCDLEKVSLTYLAAHAGIHPVHLCRGFKKYFYCTLGEYIRKIKIEKSLSQLNIKNMSLTAIAFECGFADQSHFIRCFKDINHITPLQYRKIILNKQAG